MLRNLIIDEANRQNLEYKELAERSGLSRATVHRYLAGVRDMTGERLDLLLGALGIKVSSSGLAEVRPLGARRKQVKKTKKPIVAIANAADYCDIQECDFRRLRVKARSVDLIATDVPWTLKAEKDWVEFGKRAKKWLRPQGLCAVMIGTSALARLISAVEEGGLRYQSIFPIAFHTPTAEINGIFSGWRPMVIFADAKMHRFGGKPDRLTSEGAEKQYHPYQQPVLPFRQLVKRLSKPNDLVLDCFLGTGTTAVACMTAEGGKRRFIGCDIDPKMVEIARKRLGIDNLSE